MKVICKAKWKLPTALVSGRLDPAPFWTSQIDELFVGGREATGRPVTDETGLHLPGCGGRKTQAESKCDDITDGTTLEIIHSVVYGGNG
jgi:hypothetical protein